MDTTPDMILPNADDANNTTSDATEKVPEVSSCIYCHSPHLQRIRHRGRHYWLCSDCDRWIDIPKWKEHQKAKNKDPLTSETNFKSIVISLIAVILFTIIFALCLRFFVTPHFT